jgi:hypothetical protein
MEVCNSDTREDHLAFNSYTTMKTLFPTKRIIHLLRDLLPFGPLYVPCILVPFTGSTIYLGLMSGLLPSGVNKVFVTRTFQYAIPVEALILLAFITVQASGRLRGSTLQTAQRRISYRDIVLVLLPLAPVVQYVISNRVILSNADSIMILIIFASLSSAIIFLLPALSSHLAPTRPLMYLGCALAFTITSMASLSARFSWHEWGSLKIQLPVFFTVFLFIWLLSEIGLQGVLRWMLLVYFISSSLVQAISRPADDPALPPDNTSGGLAEMISARTPLTTPSVYLLLYDAYPTSETASSHQIDNGPQEQFLVDMGFKIYPHTYSIGASTLTTMSRVLNVSLQLPEDPRDATSGNGTVIKLFRQLDYSTIGVFPSDYLFRGHVPTYEQYYPTHGSSVGLLTRAILEGEFRFDLGLGGSYDEYSARKSSVLSDPAERPVFFYSHFNRPGHSQLSGHCRPNVVREYADGLEEANAEMRRDLNEIIQTDPTAIIIVASDHGPYLTKNCAATSLNNAYTLEEITRQDILDRFGTFLAIRWPSDDFEPYDDILIVQDLFPAIFAYMYSDTSLLENRLQRVTRDRYIVSGAYVDNGIVVGGMDDGEPLYLDHSLK